MMVATLAAGCSEARDDALGAPPAARGELVPDARSAPATERGPSLPPALRAAVISTRQAEGGEGYRFEAVGAASGPAAAADNAAMAFRASFDATGVLVRRNGETAHLSLALHAVGCASAREEVPAVVAPGVAAGRLTYARTLGSAELEEWYLNGPAGLEQGFTLGRLPDCAGAEELVLEIGLGLGEAPSRAVADGTLALGAYRYGALYATDARGRELGSRLHATARGAELRIDARGASLPVTVDPLVWVEEQKLVASDGAALDNFGASVSVTADGSRALVGAANADLGPNTNQGSAYVFLRTGTSWALEQKLVAGDAAVDDFFGYSVSLSTDGSRALVGAYGDSIAANQYQGSAYVFLRAGTSWAEEQKLVASDGAASDLFGTSVSLSADGSHALVGAPGSQLADPGNGYVFLRTGTSWSEEQKLVASDGAVGDQFGGSVSLSADGSRALVGAWLDDVGASTNQGSAYVFLHTGSSWAQEQKLVARDGAASDLFGISVSLSADGSRALVGAPVDDVGANVNQGSAYAFALVFKASNGTSCSAADACLSDQCIDGVCCDAS
ncbi:MAG: FG-GAP repeat protein, partial [Myxococcales bacterium]|nr:FG-GAP repeat protein [Myxococcales bacterium]